MKIELPLETWTDVFGFVPRSQLIRLMPNLEESHKRDHQGRKCQPTNIGDRQFVSFVQFFLHKCGQITLGVLTTINDGSPKIFNKAYCKLPLADVPMPENITNFKELWLCNTGDSVLSFLQEFQRNSLLTNANLDFSAIYPARFPHFMTNIWPMLTTINSIKIEGDALDSIQCEHFDLAKPLLASARILHTKYNCRDCWLCEWLQTPREDGRPRILILHPPRNANPLHFIRHIKKDFMEAPQPISFFIHLNVRTSERAQFFFHTVQSFSLHNAKTNEKLVMKEATGPGGRMTISRYPMDVAEKWIEERAEYEDEKYQNRIIRISL